jgi:hypothetical protein
MTTEKSPEVTNDHTPRFPEVLDATILSQFRCPRKFQLATVERYGPLGDKSIHLTAGGAYAKGLEVARLAYCEGQHPASCLELGIEALIKEYGDADCGDSPKSVDRMVGALEFYFDQYPLDTDPAQIARIAGVPAVEWSFALPLPFNHPETGQPLIYAGRTDALMDFAGGLYAEDDKTTSQLGASWSRQWDLRSQFTGYCWAMRELGLNPAGVLVRGVSILKTKYDTAQAIVNEPAWKIDQWVQHRNHLIKQMLAAYQEGYFEPALDETCLEYGQCLFKEKVCNINPENRQSYLDTHFQENNWSPLHNLKGQSNNG